MPSLSRSDWGAVPPVRTVPVSKRLKGVWLHYMGFPVRTEDPVRLVQSIQRNRMATPKEWWDIAYNELIAQDGTVLEGRGMLYRSGAQGSTSHNRSYIALGLLLGDGDEPTGYHAWTEGHWSSRCWFKGRLHRTRRQPTRRHQEHTPDALLHKHSF